MNIVHIVFNIRQGGMEHFLIDLVEVQNRSDCVTVIVVNRDNDMSMIEQLQKNCRLVEIGRPEGSYNPFYILKLNRTLKRLSPDVVNYHDRRLGAMIWKRKPVNYIFTCHDMLEPPGFALRADHIISVSRAVADHLKCNYKIESTVIPNGIAVWQIKQRPETGLTNKVKLVTVARLDHTVKGQHILIEALARLNDIDYTLDLIGDGQSRNYLESLVTKLGLGNRVNFRLNIERNEIYNSLSQYDIFILPSLNEAFSIALAEALAASLPAIIPDLDGPKSVAGNGKYATIFSTGNADDLAQKIHEVIANYTAALNQAKESRDFIKKSFDITTTAARYRQFYLSCQSS